MATSKLELAVGTGQWDAGLKKAQQALNSFTQAQGGLQQALAKDNGDMQKFIQMMGKIDSTANTAKGQMNDYKRVLEQLTTQYNQMSDAQKKSIGQDYLQTIDALRQKFSQAKQQVEDFNKSLGEAGKVKMPETGGGLFGGGKLDGMLQVFGGNLMTKAAGMAAGLAMEIGDAVKQGIELAKQGEGIRIAFERLGRGDILDGLREATHGTVTDLELMKAAVKFNDFKLPVEELGTMLAFAQQKAKDTGQSVDYMVDSIVTGLGRKSLMILDNLGLSASEIKEKMKETGDMTKAVGEIIREQMQKAGDYVETAADRAAQANVSLQNKMEELGRKFAPVEEASSQLWTSMKIGILDIIGGPLATLLNQLTEAGRLKNMLNSMNGEPGSGSTKVDQQLKKLNVIKKGGGSDYIFKSTLSGMLEDYNRQIMALDAKIKDTKKLSPDQQASKFVRDEVQKMSEQMKALGMMRDQLAAGAKELSKPVDVKIETKGAEQNVESLKAKLIELEAQRKKAIAAGDTDLSKNLTKQINQTKADIKGLNPTALKTTHKKTEKVYAEGSIAWQEQEVQRLTKAWKEAGDAVRDDYAKQLEEAQMILDNMTGKVQQPNLSPIADLTGRTPTVNLTQGAEFKLPDLTSWRSQVQLELTAQNVKIDETALNNLMQDAVNNSITSMDLQLGSLGQQIAEGLDVPDEKWQAILDQYNELRAQIGEDPIQIDLKTGGIQEIKKDTDAMSKSMIAAGSAIGTVGSALRSIEDPSYKVAGIVAEAIATVAQAFGEALATDRTSKSSIYAFIGASVASMAAMISAISQIHSATGYAEGGIVKGNSYSGDNIIVPVDGGAGGYAGLNAGEIVLNKAAQGAIASQLQGDGKGLNVVGEIQGEKIVLVANRFLKRSGQGELVTWR